MWAHRRVMEVERCVDAALVRDLVIAVELRGSAAAVALDAVVTTVTGMTRGQETCTMPITFPAELVLGIVAAPTERLPLDEFIHVDFCIVVEVVASQTQEDEAGLLQDAHRHVTCTSLHAE